MDCASCDHPRAAHGVFGCTACSCTVTHPTLMAAGVRAGERARNTGIGLVLDSDRTEEWRAEAYAWIDRQPAGHRFTSVEMTDELGMPPSPYAVGAIIRASSQAGVIQHTMTYRTSARPSRHAAPIAVWLKL